MHQQGLVVFSKNKKRVSAFYQQTLSLDVIESESSHDLLRGNGYEVVIHNIPRKDAAAITIAKPPEPREETPFKPTFVVSNLSQVAWLRKRPVAISSQLRRHGIFVGT